jgi:hypothetical protein
MSIEDIEVVWHASVYIKAVRALAAHYRRSLDQLSEEEVRACLFSMLARRRPWDI